MNPLHHRQLSREWEPFFRNAKSGEITPYQSMRVPMRQAIPALTLVIAAMLAAQTTNNWTQQNPQTSPPARSYHAMAYDSGHGQTVVFGGDGYTTGITNLNDTWVWDGSNWTQKSPQTSPSIRSGSAMAYDAAHHEVVLFGGSYGSPFNDTWVWDGSNWTQMSPMTSPPARYSHAMAYDSAHGQIVMFGGVVGNNFSFFNDTWVWDGTNWTQASPQASPTARYGHAMAYDSSHGLVVLFGGAGTNGVNSDTWLWDGANWTQATTNGGPPPRYAHAMAYDSTQGDLFLFGGYNPSVRDLNDTWVWNGTFWMPESPPSSPPARDTLAMVYDSGHDQVVLFGGQNSEIDHYFSDTWTWSTPAVVTLPPAPSITAVISASAFGSFSTVAPGSWIEIYGSNLAPDTRGWTAADFNGNNAPTSLDGVKVDIGGQQAFVDYISPSQVNALLPSNISVGSMSQLTVTNANGASAPVNVTVNTIEPGLLAPASFKIAGNQYVVAILPDGNYVLPAGAIAGINSRPAKPGETIVMYGIGFGPVAPPIPAGEIDTQTNQLSNSLQVLFGTTPAQLPYFGLAPGFVGLYQFNVVVPVLADSDLEPLTLDLGTVAGPQTLFTAVHQ